MTTVQLYCRGVNRVPRAVAARQRFGVGEVIGMASRAHDVLEFHQLMKGSAMMFPGKAYLPFRP
jgi:hypothetical protein